MSYPRSPGARSRREREFHRMVSRLNLGTPPSRISGDRDVLQAAIEHVQRQCDVADDIGREAIDNGRIESDARGWRGWP